MENNLSYSVELRKTVITSTLVSLDDNDIFNWLSQCQNPETLKYLGKVALKFAHDIENKKEESWHSDVLD